MNKLFILLRLLNYLFIITILVIEKVPLSGFQIGITFFVCLWGVWDFCKKPHDPTHILQRGIWLELATITLWLTFIPHEILLYAFISPLARGSIHLYSRGRFIVYSFILVVSGLFGVVYSISRIWPQLVAFTLIFIYCSVLSSLINEREKARKLLALSGFEREQQAKDGERIRISRQLHDTLGQYWTSVIRALDVAEVIEEPPIKQEFILKAREAAVLGLEEMRKTVRNWNEKKRTPEQWLDYGRNSLQHIQKLTNVRIQSQLEDVYWNLFQHSEEVAETLVRAMLEGVSNAIRHGNASTIKINLKSTSDRIQLFIRDDGIGLIEKNADSMGIGLLSLRSLTEELDGKLVIESSSYQGTTLFLTIPLDKNDLGGVSLG